MQATPEDIAFVRRALSLAVRGRGFVEPNPMVGCVIVREGRVLGEGWHRRYGQAHAEPEALATCTEDPRGATAYVTLEPCCHTDKKTPPCVPALVAAGLARVVVGCADPNPAVAGRGMEQLRAAGVQVDGPLLESECRQLNAAFFVRVLHRRPYVTLKWAQSADGKVAGPGGRRVQISNPTAMRVIHELRGRCDAILVGINTVLNDDPRLTPRIGEPARVPMRVVLDSQLRMPAESLLVRTAGQTPVIVYCLPERSESEQADGLRLRGVQVRAAGNASRGRQVAIAEVLSDLGRRDVTHLLVEPGPTLARGFLEQSLADRVWVDQSPTVIGADTAPAAPVVNWPASGKVELAGDVLREQLDPGSAVFFASAPSADLQLAGGGTEMIADQQINTDEIP